MLSVYYIIDISIVICYDNLTFKDIQEIGSEFFDITVCLFKLSASVLKCSNQ